MKADWEVIKRGDVMPRYAGLYVTLNPKGDIVMSRFTWETMGGPKAFFIMWDAPNQRIGLLRTVPEKKRRLSGANCEFADEIEAAAGTQAVEGEADRIAAYSAVLRRAHR
ncbi:MAG: hypothetical protein IPM59_02490 [Chloracidobacterium sp.]|nr:hypothetical protein [Chloracidobacterium sp.]